MSKTNTELKDLATERDCALRSKGWTLCLTCGEVMVLSVKDARAVPEAFASLRFALVTLSHFEPDADGGEVAALECMDCNGARGRKVWAPRTLRGFATVRKGERGARDAYRKRLALRREAKRPRSLPLA